MCGVWSVENNFFLGTKFLLQTDNHPLEFLFNQNKALPKMTNARILRWALKIMTFDFTFDIAYIKGNSIPHVDALSRLNYDDNSQTVIMKNDRLLQDITQCIQSNNWSGCSPAEWPYKMNRTHLMIEDSIIYCGECSYSTFTPKTHVADSS